MTGRSNFGVNPRNVFASIFLLIALFVLFELASIIYFMEYRMDDVMNEFGFGLVDAYPKIDGEYKDFVGIGKLQESGLMYQAGFRDGDLLQEYPTGWGVRKFIRHMDAHRGEEVTVKVVGSGDGPPLQERPVRIVRITVPETSAK